MKERVTVVTRKGQITIPAEIRRVLHINVGDKVVVSLEEDGVKLKPSAGVVARTAGALKSDSPLLTPEQEREAAERAVAEEVVSRIED